jgi:hypothetical protein
MMGKKEFAKCSTERLEEYQKMIEVILRERDEKKGKKFNVLSEMQVIYDALPKHKKQAS